MEGKFKLKDLTVNNYLDIEEKFKHNKNYCQILLILKAINDEEGKSYITSIELASLLHKNYVYCYQLLELFTNLGLLAKTPAKKKEASKYLFKDLVYDKNLLSIAEKIWEGVNETLTKNRRGY